MGYIVLNYELMSLLKLKIWSEVIFMNKQTKKPCSVRLYLQLFVGGLMLYLRYLCLFVYSGVQHILCCVFVSLPLVYPMLPVSLDCPLLIAPSVFSRVYITYIN
jgi:hypothetical protein